uniref:BHLH domain-containing protein n=1 Tax=Ciona savignyi TaxID=51511 RepID=H2ZP90_CIOSA
VDSRKRRCNNDVTSEAKRRRSNYGKERGRLSVFNQALETLQGVIPIRLTEQKKLHKKQTLQLAIRYINFLRGCLDGSRDWNERNRFWCQSQDEMMITAIDQAAAPHITSSDITSPSRPVMSSYNIPQHMTYTDHTSTPITSNVVTANDTVPQTEALPPHHITSFPQHNQLKDQNMTSQLNNDLIHSTEPDFFEHQNHDAAYSQYDPTASFLSSYFLNNDVTHPNNCQTAIVRVQQVDDVNFPSHYVLPSAYDVHSNYNATNHNNDVIQNQSTTERAFADLEEILSSPKNNCYLPESPESGYNS